MIEISVLSSDMTKAYNKKPNKSLLKKNKCKISVKIILVFYD